MTLLFAYAVVFTTFVAYRLLGWANARMATVVIALSTCLSPPLTAGMAWLVDGAAVTTGQIMGTLLIFAAVGLVSIMGQPQHQHHTARPTGMAASLTRTNA